MILICGASGLLGKELCKLLDDKDIKYVGTYNTNKINDPRMYKINFSDSLFLENFLVNHEIKCCIFCIVERLLDKCENNWNEIKHTNIDLVQITSHVCNKLNVKFIHFSTDYVFDGSSQPNLPVSFKNPLQNYGISKLISEYRVIQNCKNYCIIRTPVLYSSLSKVHDNAVCLIGKNVMDLRNRTCYEDNYCIRRPLYIKDLCIFILDCINQYNGIFHFYNPYNKFTKYKICNIIGNYLNIDIDKIKPNNKCDGIVHRPYDTQLADDNINVTNYSFTDFNETIHECFQKFKHTKICIENKNDFFICLDMDGTIIDTNIAHYNAYKNAFKLYDKDFLSIDEWSYIIQNDNIDNYLKQQFDEKMIIEIKTKKIEFLKNETITCTKNSDIFLKFLIENSFNFCIVTNTNKKTVDIFKQHIPFLNDVTQWIYRENYSLPKPSSECYILAKNLYYKNEKYIIGFEDSLVGYHSLKFITDIIYIYDNEKLFKNNDCFLFDNYNIFSM
jgi:dTDP-4-dehydrorhamnose reductase